jgi:hypothetical protein
MDGRIPRGRASATNRPTETTRLRAQGADMNTPINPKPHRAGYAQVTVRRDADGTFTIHYGDASGSESRRSYTSKSTAMAEALVCLGCVFGALL